jgi:hypothetical protein
MLALNKNRSDDGRNGLQIICNDFTCCRNDISVDKINRSAKLMGIREYQGNDGTEATSPANNTFSWVNMDFSDYYNNCENIIYCHLDSTLTIFHIKPNDYSSTVNPHPAGTNSFEYNKELCCPSDLDSNGKSGTEIGLIKLDYSGFELWNKTWGDMIASWYVGYPGSLITINNDYYLAGSKNYYSPYSYDSGLLMKLNSTWDTIWTKDYNLNIDNEPDTSILFNQMDICFNNDLIFGGGLYKSGSSGSKFLLIRTDTAGIIKWYKTYSVTQSGINDGYSVIQTSDHGFAIGGFWYIPGDQSATGDPIIIKTDSLGNLEWIKNLGGPIVDNRAMLCRANEVNILMGTTIADSLTGGNSTFSRINVVKMDNEGNILWNKKYGESSFSNFLSNIRCLEDSSIICTGSVWTDVPGRVGWVMKLNSEGDSLWYRQYYLLNGGSSLNYLRDIVQVSDNGYVACGYISPISPDTGIQSAWVIKLDSVGCDSAGCDSTVGVKEHGGMEAWEHGGMEIWPNPAKEILNFKFSILNSGEAYSIYIYDILGREVMKTTVDPQNRAVSLNVSNLESGFYLAVAKDLRNRIFKGKFIIGM